MTCFKGPDGPDSVALAVEVDRLCARFEKAWQHSERPDLARWLPAEGALRQAALLELARLDLEYRLRAGEVARAEDYFTSYPELRADTATALSLIACEARLRAGQEPGLSAQEYRSRFPDLTAHAGWAEALTPLTVFTPSPQAGAAAEPFSTLVGEAPTLVAPREETGVRLRLQGELGRGGMGAVLRGRDSALGRDVAVKVLLEQHADRPDLVRRFVEEAQVCGQLQHPSVVPVYDLDRFGDGRPFFTMKLVEGRTLAELLAERASPEQDRPRFLKVFEQVCQALGYAHSHGVIHRDLKPANIMVGAFGEVQVMDWGLAKVLGRSDPSPPAPLPEAERGEKAEAGATTLTGPCLAPPSPLRGGGLGGRGQADHTQPGAVMGTPAYMAPEQARGEVDQLDERADVFGLGAILCEVLTGQPPFPGQTTEALRRARQAELEDTFRRLDGCGADGELVVLAKRSLAAQREDRPRNAAALAAELTAYLESVEARLRQAELERAQAQVKAAEERKRRKVQLALAGALLLLVLVGGGAAWALKEARAEAERVANAELARQRETGQKALLALERGRGLLEEGWRNNDLTRIEQARAEANRAADVAGSGAEEDVQQQAADFQKEAEGKLARAKKNQALLVALGDVSTPREIATYTRDPAGRLMPLAQPSAEEQYAAAFRKWGLDVDRVPEAEVVARLKDEPEPVLQEIIAGLDAWMLERRRKGPEGAWRRLLRLAGRLDRSAPRRQLRAVLAGERLPQPKAAAGLAGALASAAQPWSALAELELGRHRGLLELRSRVRPETEPALTVALLARACVSARDNDGAESVLRRGLARRPDEVVLLDELARLLEGEGRSRLGEAIECFRAARAVRPQLGIALAEALRKFGKPDEGEAVLRDLIRRQPNNPETYAYLGNALREQKKLVEAETAYRQAIALRPTSAPAWHNLGTALYAQKKLGAAVAAFEKAIDLQPDLAKAYFHLSRTLDDQKKKKATAAALRKGMALEPDDAETYNARGFNLLDEKKDAEAVAAFKKAIALQADYADAYDGLGQALRALKRPAESAAAHRRAIAFQPDHVDAYINLGLALGDQGKYAEAEAVCRKAIEAQPDNATAHNNLGYYLYRQNRRNEAVAAYRKAIELGPTNVLAHTNLGLALRELRRLDESEAAYRKAVALQPRDAQAHLDLGLTLRERKKLEEAAIAFRTAIARRPNDAWAFMNLGLTLLDQHKVEEGLAACRRAGALQPKNGEIYNYLGIALLSQKKFDEAAAAWRKAIDLGPTNAVYHVNLSVALRNQKKLGEAVAECRKALALRPESAVAYENLGLALREQKKLAEAVAAFKKADELAPNQPSIRDHLRQTERWLRLLPKLDAYLAGKEKPASPQESAELGEVCASVREQYRSALALYADAFKADPKLANDLQTSHRYNAACAAVLASAGPEEKDRAGLRKQARDWLVADLQANRALLEKGKENRPIVQQRLAHWQGDADLASVRDKALATLPEGERREWQKFWADVGAVRRKIEADTARDLGPPDPSTYYHLGNALHARKDYGGAIAAFRKAIELAPRNDSYHNRLGNALYAKGDREGAVAAYRKAIALRPGNGVYHNNLGNALRDQRKFALAAGAYREAVKLDPKYVAAHNNLGNALFSQGDWAGAAAAYRKAIELAPENVVYQTNLAGALRRMGDLDGAVAACRKAIALKEDHAAAHNILGLALREQKKLVEAVAAFKKAGELAPKQVAFRNNLRQTERWLRLAPKLDACLAGKEKPASPQEGVELGEMCAYYRRDYGAAVNFARDAFKVDPKLANEVRAGRRSAAAAWAVLAAAGKGKDAGALDEARRGELRRQARDWLQTDLKALMALAQSAKDRAFVGQRLAAWQSNPDLGSVRDRGALGRLSGEEREGWQQFWGEVAGLRGQVQGKK